VTQVAVCSQITI